MWISVAFYRIICVIINKNSALNIASSVLFFDMNYHYWLSDIVARTMNNNILSSNLAFEWSFKIRFKQYSEIDNTDTIHQSGLYEVDMIWRWYEFQLKKGMKVMIQFHLQFNVITWFIIWCLKINMNIYEDGLSQPAWVEYKTPMKLVNFAKQLLSLSSYKNKQQKKRKKFYNINWKIFFWTSRFLTALSLKKVRTKTCI